MADANQSSQPSTESLESSENSERLSNRKVTQTGSKTRTSTRQRSENKTQLQPLLKAIQAVKNGDLTVRLSEENGLGEVAKEFNQMVSQIDLFAGEVTRVTWELGTEGKLDARATVEGAAGTWKELIDNTNAMSANLAEQMRSIADVTSAISQGNLSQQIEAQNAGEFQDLTQSVNQMIANLKASMKQIADISTTVASAAEETTAVSTEMAENATQTAEQATSASASAEQVSTNATSVATAVEEMNASIREIAKNAAVGAQVANTAVQTADRTNDTITKLGQSSGEIGKVIKVITSIAQQTNLLALNATSKKLRGAQIPIPAASGRGITEFALRDALPLCS
ncbi:methyl-accepting chemotaxis protein [Scytonema millei]|uniref:methyl-accepting chemotaxis protein n=1 Tax=Scytonema millei TaxID=1245922 RepID=UPI000AF109E8|nr:methyl-accepting chemotaxis protein [Scytonema millei]